MSARNMKVSLSLVEHIVVGYGKNFLVARQPLGIDGSYRTIAVCHNEHTAQDIARSLNNAKIAEAILANEPTPVKHPADASKVM